MTCSGQSSSEKKKQEEYNQIKEAIISKRYHFIALSATTSNGKTFQLSSGYYLQIMKDSLKVDLPYYGRSYTSSYGESSAEIGIQFNTNQFAYVADSIKDGGWDITIKPKNQKSADNIYLSVSISGYSRVKINSSNRSMISYYGTIVVNLNN